MQAETKEWLLLTGKTLLLIIGGVLTVAALVELVVDGYSHVGAVVLVLGLALAVPPLAFAFRDAVGEARKGRI